MPRFSLAVLVTNPTQLDGPLFSRISQAGVIDLTVYYLGTEQVANKVDNELGFSPNWDIPITEGYRQVVCPRQFVRRVRFLWRECLVDGKYDLVVVPGYARLDTNLLALAPHRQPLGMRLDTAPIYSEPTWKAWCKRIILRRFLRRFASLHPVGSLTETFLKTSGVNPARMFRFPYAADNEYLTEIAKPFRQERARWLHELGIPATAFVTLGVLKFVPRENPMELLRGFHLFHQRFPDSVLILVGAGALRREMEAYMAASRLTDSVRLVGYSKYSELPRWYALSNVFVHPAIRECWGVSVNEAMACRLPVVASSLVGSSYDLIQDGANGYQYPSGDVEALADCLAKIASRPDHGSGLGERSADIIKAWDFEATMRSLESALRMIKAEIAQRGVLTQHFAAPRDVVRGQQDSFG